MRRKLTKKAVLYIIIIALLTLSSYAFDQTVIRQEDKLRNAQIKLENLNVEIDNFESISTQLTNLEEQAIFEYTSLKRNNSYWLKAILLYSDHDKISYLKDIVLPDRENVNANIIKVRFAEHQNAIYRAHTNIGNKYGLIYWWHKKLFKNESYEIEYLKTFNEIINHLNVKEIDTYIDIANQEKRKKIIDNLTIDNWLDFHKYAHALINKLLTYPFYINLDQKRVEKLYAEKENARYETIENILDISTKKNYAILLSIICQILSLLFLLILFRNLITKKV